MASAQQLLSDIVRDSKIETDFLGTCFRHVFYDTGRSASERRVRKEETWVRDRFLGKGAYGTVYLERCDDGGSKQSRGRPELRAVKEIGKAVAGGQVLDYARELEAIFKFSHPKYAYCFVRSTGWFEQEHSIYIAMEYLELGDLQRYLAAPLPEDDARQITSQVLEGLGFMHENGFVHRDIKPGNIMVVTKEPAWFVKITDFGISKRRQEDVTAFYTSQQGTVTFAAPEAFGVSPAGKVESYTFSVDMWSLGAVAYRMLAGTTAFGSILELMQFVMGMLPFPRGPLEARGPTGEAVDFILKLMAAKPEDRLSASGAREHPWMQVASPPMRASASVDCSNTAITEESEPGDDTWLTAASKPWSPESTVRPDEEQTARPLLLMPSQPQPSRDDDRIGDTNEIQPSATDGSSEPGTAAETESMPSTDNPPAGSADGLADSTPANPCSSSPAATAVLAPRLEYRPPYVEDCDEDGSNLRPSLPADSESSLVTVTTHETSNDLQSRIDLDGDASYRERTASRVEVDDSQDQSEDESEYGSEYGSEEEREDTTDNSRTALPIEPDQWNNIPSSWKKYYVHVTDESRAVGAARPYDSEGETKSGGEMDQDEEDTLSFPVECVQCKRVHIAPLGPIEMQACEHFICHRCILKKLALALLSPAHMPPRCCGLYRAMDEKVVLEEYEGFFNRIDMSFEPDLIEVWDTYKEIKLHGGWRCERGFPALYDELAATDGKLTVWKASPTCSRCVTKTHLPVPEALRHPTLGPMNRRNVHCLLCGVGKDSKSRCRCKGVAAVNAFVKLLTDLSITCPWGEDHVGSHVRLRQPEVTGLEDVDYREPRPKPDEVESDELDEDDHVDEDDQGDWGSEFCGTCVQSSEYWGGQPRARVRPTPVVGIRGGCRSCFLPFCVRCGIPGPSYCQCPTYNERDWSIQGQTGWEHRDRDLGWESRAPKGRSEEDVVKWVKLAREWTEELNNAKLWVISKGRKEDGELSRRQAGA